MSELTEAAVSALREGQVIKAIKITRVASGAGLKEAKEQVDAYLHSHPELKAQLPQMSQEAVFRLFVVFVGAALLVWFFLK